MEPGSPRVLAPKRPVRRRPRWPLALTAVGVAGALAAVALATKQHDGSTRLAARATTTTTTSTATTVATTTTTTPTSTVVFVPPPPPPPPPPVRAVVVRTTTTTRPAPSPPPPPPPTTTTSAVPSSSPDVDARDDRATVNGDIATVAVLRNDLPRAGMLDPATLAIEIAPPVGTTKVRNDGRIEYRGPPNVRFWYRICSTTGGCGYAAVTIYPAK